jgi:hypothetical protein
MFLLDVFQINLILINIVKVKVKLFLCLTKYHVMKMYSVLN